MAISDGLLTNPIALARFPRIRELAGTNKVGEYIGSSRAARGPTAAPRSTGRFADPRFRLLDPRR